MGLLSRVAAALQAFDASRQIKDVSGAQQAFARIIETGMDQVMSNSALTRPYEQHPTIYAAISAIATSLSAVPLEFFRDSDAEREVPVTDSLPVKLLSAPSEDMDLRMLLCATIIYRELCGEAFWFLDGFAQRGPGGPRYPTKIELWDPSCVKHFVEDRKIVRWEYRAGGYKIDATPAAVISFKYFNPYDPYRGLPPWAPARVVATADHKGNVWNEAFLSNAAIPAGLLVPEVAAGPVHADAVSRLRDEFESRHQGAGKHGRIGAINIAMKFLEIGLSHKDMDFGALLDSATERILMIWKVPPTVAGMSKNANYQEATRQAKQFWHNHEPTLHYIESRIKRRLCEPFGIEESPYFKTETIKALIEDQESVARTAREFWAMGVPFEQINARLELGYDAKAHLGMRTPWIPFSMVDADEQAEMGIDSGPDRTPVPGDTPNQPGDMPTQDDPESMEEMSARPGRLRLMPKDETVRTINWKRLISKVRDEEAVFERRVRDHLFKLKLEVLANLRGEKSVRKQDDDPAEISIDAVLFDRDKAAEDIKRRTDGIYKSAAQKGIESVLAELQIEIDFDLLTDEVASFLRGKRFEIADLVDGPTEQRLKTTLQEGLSAGESIEKIADRVEDAFSVERSRARRIARTEIAESFNGGRYETMKVAGVQKLEWLTARDARVRDEHIEVDGEVIEMGDSFSNGLRYPLDPQGPPEQIVNCRCVALPAA